ncbi:MAG TPA: hypothetical protein VE869_16460 [Gemmatimonas sp.]|nr:hypothetical protein [Gemmatimonas sp.]
MCVLFSALASALAPNGARAQRTRGAYSQLFVDVGVARLALPSSQAQPLTGASSNAGVLGIGAQRVGSIVSLGGQLAATIVRESSARGGFTALDSRAGALQATLTAALVPPVARWFQADATLTGTRFGAPTPSSAVGGSNQAWRMRSSAMHRIGPIFAGVSVALARSTTARDDGSGFGRAASRFVATGTDVGAWVGYRWLSLSVTGTRTLTDDYPLVEASRFVLVRPSASYDLRDLAITGSAAAGRVELQHAYVRRTGAGATRGRATASSVSAAVALTRSVALVASHGETLADQLRGTVGARVSSVALRWRVGSRGVPGVGAANAVGRRERSSVMTPTSSRGVASAAVERVPSGGAVVTIRVDAPRETVVEYATSHGDWQPARATFDGSVHLSTVTLPAGVHRLSVRVNGGEWYAPIGLVSERDEFGGSRGIVVVP